ncbi:MAG: hypothetical protein DRJ41_00420 [Thermoprotei archaeon]|nr:MAG: hypothetical protein DRJ43_04390 [Thermoprotei archaeon]RLE85829.1 MAG: hypothetical protein DRJ41_00420 [Thermoprotei archaeon]
MLLRRNLIIILLIVSLISSTIILEESQISPVKAQELPVPREETLFMEAGGAETYDKFNPFIPGGTPGGASGYLLMECLWYVDWITGKRTWWLATGYEYSENYTVFTIHVRKGVTWNDGVPFTARDIAFTINMVRKTPGLYWHSILKDTVKSAEAIDNYTAVIRLKRPNPRFHLLFVKIWPLPIVPEHIWKDKDPLTFKNWPPVWTGPYKLYKVIPELKMWIWVRREDYWGKKFGFFPGPKYVVCRLTPPSKDVDFADIVKGYIDIANGIITDYALVDLAKRTNPKLIVTPVPDVGGQLGGSRGIYINCAKYPLSLREVRWAIAYAINREKICNVTYKGYAVPTWYYKAPGLTVYPFSLLKEVYDKYPLKYDPAKANEILDKLGFKRGKDGIRVTPNGTRLSFELAVPGEWPEARSNALLVAEDLKAIGIEVKVTTLTGAVYMEKRELGHFDMFCQWGIGWIVDPMETLIYFHSKYYTPIGKRARYHYLRWTNKTFDKILDELSSIPSDHPKAPELYKKLFEIYISELPVIPLVHHKYAFVFSTKYWTGWPTLDNLYCNPTNWNPTIIFVLFKLRPVKKPPAVITYLTTYITKSVPAFTGVDGKKYGPYKPGDVAVLPKEDAERLVAEGLASFSPPTPKILPAILESVKEVSESIKGLRESIKALEVIMTGMTSIAYASIGVSIITLIVVLVVLVTILRKKS